MKHFGKDDPRRQIEPGTEWQESREGFVFVKTRSINRRRKLWLKLMWERGESSSPSTISHCGSETEECDVWRDKKKTKFGSGVKRQTPRCGERWQSDMLQGRGRLRREGCVPGVNVKIDKLELNGAKTQTEGGEEAAEEGRRIDLPQCVYFLWSAGLQWYRNQRGTDTHAHTLKINTLNFWI